MAEIAEDLTQLFEQLSGSDELRVIQRRQLKVKEAEEENAVVFGKKKTLMSQRKQIKEQKDEAEKTRKIGERVEGIEDGSSDDEVVSPGRRHSDDAREKIEDCEK